MAQPASIKVTRSDRVIVPKARLSYPHVFKPSAFQGEGEPKYSACFLVPKAEKDFYKAVKAAQTRAVDELYGAKKPQNFETWGIADGDEADDSTAAGCWVIKASNRIKPKVVDAKGVEIIDETDVYGGCYARASVQAKAYGTNQKGGVTLELLVVQKVADGTPFGGAAKSMANALDELGVFEEEEAPF